MDRRERLDDFSAGLQDALRGWQAKMWTALPGQFVSFDASKSTAVVQPTIELTQTHQDGSTSQVTISQCKDCPVIFPHGGGLHLTFPIEAGDECLIVFANRCIDGWWQNGGVQPQLEVRLHDLSDGFCVPGPYSQPNKLSSISTDSTQLRTTDGQSFVELTQGGNINLNSPNGTVTVNAVTCNVNADTVNLGGEGGPAVARIGDLVQVANVTGNIISGSSKVFST